MTQSIRESSWDRDGIVRSILDPVKIPKMARVRQLFPDDRIADIPSAVAGQLARPEIRRTIRAGMKIAITVGSRGIANIPLIAAELARNIKSLGGEPFIIPAMGSHGGATAEGQRAVLEALGVTERSVGAPIHATMETVVVGSTERGQSVHMDKHAAGADGIIVLGRVKPHTAFRGEFESGLLKMMAIGMGKRQGAEICHAEGFGRMAENVPAFARVVLKEAKILFGLAVVENAFDATSIIEAIPRDSIEDRERSLLATAKELMPRILFPEFDVLIVDRIGKNFSGDGADPNITGTYCTPYAEGGPQFQRYVVLDASDETHGNSLGVGMADVTTKRLFDKSDFDASYPNALTSRVLKTIRMPMVLNNDRLAIQASLYTSVGIGPEGARIVRIPNTSHVDVISVSEALIAAARSHPEIEILDAPEQLAFDGDGNLL
ncbi:MAG TPA: lactate racemase domain-containing protein [Spirochaetia bacterium]|nr:lactate racemase domain-containing protein [Spirochaetia bacterium]